MAAEGGERGDERRRYQCARLGPQGSRADLLGWLGLCDGLQADCGRPAGTSKGPHQASSGHMNTALSVLFSPPGTEPIKQERVRGRKYDENNLPPLPSLCFKTPLGPIPICVFLCWGFKGQPLRVMELSVVSEMLPCCCPPRPAILDPITEPRPSWHLSQAEIM